jgi:hypothetical protein
MQALMKSYNANFTEMQALMKSYTYPTFGQFVATLPKDVQTKLKHYFGSVSGCTCDICKLYINQWKETHNKWLIKLLADNGSFGYDLVKAFELANPQIDSEFFLQACKLPIVIEAEGTSPSLVLNPFMNTLTYHPGSDVLDDWCAKLDELYTDAPDCYKSGICIECSSWEERVRILKSVCPLKIFSISTGKEKPV